ncbi:hypothetical protein GSbR_36880 [Geobacter sp. SVR]|nr:hypothetical protein GSbR_36880 [Geobacter sp. SVR]
MVAVAGHMNDLPVEAVRQYVHVVAAVTEMYDQIERFRLLTGLESLRVVAVSV